MVDMLVEQRVDKTVVQWAVAMVDWSDRYSGM